MSGGGKVGQLGSPTARQADRDRMVDEQLIAHGIRDPRVLAALRAVPRHLFVDSELADKAYEDHPLPIGRGQTISQPYMVARMTELCAPNDGDKVLEIGAGSGYQTAVLAMLVRRVFAVERIPELAERARARLDALGLHSAEIAAFDGTAGWPEHSPYDAILVAAGSPRVPALLCDQLAEGGRLVIPIGGRRDQRLAKVVRHGDEYETRWDTACRFVDLVGRYGWSEQEPPQA